MVDSSRSNLNWWTLLGSPLAALRLEPTAAAALKQHQAARTRASEDRVIWRPVTRSYTRSGRPPQSLSWAPAAGLWQCYAKSAAANELRVAVKVGKTIKSSTRLPFLAPFRADRATAGSDIVVRSRGRLRSKTLYRSSGLSDVGLCVVRVSRP